MTQLASELSCQISMAFHACKASYKDNREEANRYFENIPVEKSKYQWTKHKLPHSTESSIVQFAEKKKFVVAKALIEEVEYLVVAFRGTADLDDLKSDLSAWASAEYEGRVHYGFLRKSFEVNVVPVLEYLSCNPSTRVIVTGHSLGGAVAELFMYRLIRSSQFGDGWLDRVQYIGFASPFVGDESYCKSINTAKRQGVPIKSRFLHIVNSNDIVPSIFSIIEEKILPQSSDINLVKGLSDLLVSHITGNFKKVLLEKIGQVGEKLMKVLFPTYRASGEYLFLSHDSIFQPQNDEEIKLKLLERYQSDKWTFNTESFLQHKLDSYHSVIKSTVLASFNANTPQDLYPTTESVLPSINKIELCYSNNHFKLIVKGVNTGWLDSITLDQTITPTNVESYPEATYYTFDKMPPPIKLEYTFTAEKLFGEYFTEKVKLETEMENCAEKSDYASLLQFCCFLTAIGLDQEISDTCYELEDCILTYLEDVARKQTDLIALKECCTFATAMVMNGIPITEDNIKLIVMQPKYFLHEVQKISVNNVSGNSQQLAIGCAQQVVNESSALPEVQQHLKHCLLLSRLKTSTKFEKFNAYLRYHTKLSPLVSCCYDSLQQNSTVCKHEYTTYENNTPITKVEEIPLGAYLPLFSSFKNFELNIQVFYDSDLNCDIVILPFDVSTDKAVPVLKKWRTVQNQEQGNHHLKKFSALVPQMYYLFFLFIKSVLIQEYDNTWHPRWYNLYGLLWGTWNKAWVSKTVKMQEYGTQSINIFLYDLYKKQFKSEPEDRLSNLEIEAKIAALPISEIQSNLSQYKIICCLNKLRRCLTKYKFMSVYGPQKAGKGAVLKTISEGFDSSTTNHTRDILWQKFSSTDSSSRSLVVLDLPAANDENSQHGELTLIIVRFCSIVLHVYPHDGEAVNTDSSIRRLKRFYENLNHQLLQTESSKYHFIILNKSDTMYYEISKDICNDLNNAEKDEDEDDDNDDDNEEIDEDEEDEEEKEIERRSIERFITRCNVLKQVVLENLSHFSPHQILVCSASPSHLVPLISKYDKVKLIKKKKKVTMEPLLQKWDGWETNFVIYYPRGMYMILTEIAIHQVCPDVKIEPRPLEKLLGRFSSTIKKSPLTKK